MTRKSNYTGFLLATLMDALYAADETAAEVEADLRTIGGPARRDSLVDYEKTPEILAVISNLESTLTSLRELLNTEVR